MADDQETAALQSINAELERMVAGEVEPYEAGCHVWSTAGRSVELSPVVASLYLIWAALTDWPELRHEEKIEAEAVMLRAAAEWLGLDDGAARKKYCDRWKYEELGYERPVKFEGNLLVTRPGAAVGGLTIRVSDDEGVTLFDSEAPDSPRIHSLSVVGLDGHLAVDKERLAVRGKKRSLVWLASRVTVTQGVATLWLREWDGRRTSTST
jgi:hypothetical protein